MTDIEEGKTYEARWPFIRRKYDGFDEDGPFEGESWSPGIVYEPVYPDDSQAVAKAEGKAIYKIVSLHKPGHYPLRVFYVRQFRDPDGKVFGKRGLKVMTAPAFKRRLKGFLVDYEIDPDLDAVK